MEGNEWWKSDRAWQDTWDMGYGEVYVYAFIHVEGRELKDIYPEICTIEETSIRKRTN